MESRFSFLYFCCFLGSSLIVFLILENRITLFGLIIKSNNNNENALPNIKKLSDEELSALSIVAIFTKVFRVSRNILIILGELFFVIFIYMSFFEKIYPLAQANLNI